MLTQIQKNYRALNQGRRELIAKSNEALSKSKRAIFALHRNDHKEAETLVADATTLFSGVEKMFRALPTLKEEGSYRAALEEYAEARLFAGYLSQGKIIALESRASEPTVYLAGLSDMTGELVRYATRQVTLGNRHVVKDVQEVVTMVIEFLLDVDLTGYLRTKFDQAKKNLSRLEQMSYDVAIRERTDL